MSRFALPSRGAENGFIQRLLCFVAAKATKQSLTSQG